MFVRRSDAGRRRSPWTLRISTLVVLAVGGVAYAAGARSAATINGCYSTSTGAGGLPSNAWEEVDSRVTVPRGEAADPRASPNLT